jgi:hypothetical protein
VEFNQAVVLQLIILLLGMLSLFIGFKASRLGSPVWAIFGRWTRWAFIATLVASTLRLFEWSGIAFPILLMVVGLAYFLLETLYNWIAISALSKSDLPLFPRYEENPSGEEWPSEPSFIALRDWLRSNGFQRQQALKATLGNNILMRISSHDSADKKIRLQILLLPNERGSCAVCASFLSVTKSGKTLLTDNVFLPFGGFYPDEWSVERRPWTRSIGKLHDRHKARIDAVAEPLQPFTSSPYEQIRQDQQHLEQLNQELGFLTNPHDVEDLGRLTPAGKARVWQEVWTLAYLGLPLSY